MLSVISDRMCAAQKVDPSRCTCFSGLVSEECITSLKVSYVLENYVLMRKLSPTTDSAPLANVKADSCASYLPGAGAFCGA